MWARTRIWWSDTSYLWESRRFGALCSCVVGEWHEAQQMPQPSNFRDLFFSTAEILELVVLPLARKETLTAMGLKVDSSPPL